MGVKQMNEYIKRCPLCGGTAQPRYTDRWKEAGPYGYTCNMLMKSKPGFIMCDKCGCRTNAYSRVSTAIERWNRRVNEE